MARGQPCTNTESYLHESNWQSHLAKRPELEGHKLSVKATVSDPDFALRDPDGVLFKYRYGHGSGKTTGLWLLVIEGADSLGAYYVKTMCFTGEIVPEEPFCIRRVPQRRR